MGRINSDAKGKAYERKIAKALSKWVGISLIRTPMSGGWQGTSGDVRPKADWEYAKFPLLIECKNNNSVTLESVFNGNLKFHDWLMQCAHEVQKDFELTKQYRFPFLIFTRNRQPDYLAMPALGGSIITGPATQLMVVAHKDILVQIYTVDRFVSAISYSDFIATINQFPYSEYLDIMLTDDF